MTLNNKINYYSHKKPNNLVERLKLLRKLKKKLKNKKYDYLQISNLELLLLVPYLSKKTKVIFDMHEDFEGTLYDKQSLPSIFRKLLPSVYKKYINHLINSEKLTITYVTTPLIKEKFPQENVYIIENLAPLMDKSNQLIESEKQMKLKDTNKFNIIFTGLMTEKRGLLNVIKSISLLKDVNLYLVGISSQEFKKQMKEKVEDYNLSGDIIFIESLPYNEMIQLMEQMDAGIIPYLTNKNHIVTRPNKIFEYMAASIPVLSSDFPLYREIVNQGCGLTFIPEEVESIVSAIEKLKSLDHKEMGKEGKKLYLEKYNWGEEEKRIFHIIKQHGGK